MKVNKSLLTCSLGLLFVVILCYFPSITGGFHFDDSHSIQNNISVQSLKHIISFWTDPSTSSFIPENRNYRPLLYTFYSICWWLGGGQTWPFHFLKIFFHFFMTLSVFLIWKKLWSTPGWFPSINIKFGLPFVSREVEINPISAAFVLAFIFAIHPAGSECVDYISATSSLQCSVFYAWAYYLYLCFRESKAKKLLILSCFVYFLSVASKEEGITLPAMVAVTELFLTSGSTIEKVKKGIQASFLYVLVAGCLAFWLYKMHPTEGNESRGYLSSYEYFLTQWRAYLWYMRLWFWPWNLNADNVSVVFSKSITEPLVIQSAIGNLLIIGLSWTLRRVFPALLFGIVWFYITISPASSVVVLAEAINEHRMYLAYLGFIGGTFTVFLSGLEKLYKISGIPSKIGIELFLICFGLAIGTQERNRVWETDESLWLDTVEKNPTSGRALNNLALVYLSRGEYVKAIENLKKCESYWTTYMYCPLNLGISYFGLAQVQKYSGQFDQYENSLKEAENAYERAYRLNSRSVHVNFHLGKFNHEIKGNCEKAVGFYKASIAATGGRYPEAETRLANCYKNLKKYDEAILTVSQVLNQLPEYEPAILEKASILLEKGDLNSSEEIYQKLLAVAPTHSGSMYGLALVRMTKGDFINAKAIFERLLASEPLNEQVLWNFSICAEKTHSFEQAVYAAMQLVRISPKNSTFQKRLNELNRLMVSRK